MRRLLCGIACLVVACAAPQRADAHRIESQVWSPYCPGRLLIDCPTKQADELRAQIEAKVRSGQSADDILRFVRLNFGDEAIARADTALVWSLPIALFVIGIPLLIVLLRRWTNVKGALHADS